MPDAVETGGQHRGLQQIRVGRAVGEAQLEAAGIRDADHVGAVVAGIGHGIGRPGGARQRRRRVDALVGIHRRVGDRAQRFRGMHEAADEMIGGLRQAELALRVLEQVLVALGRPQRGVHVAAAAGEVAERLRHEGRAQPVLLGDRLDHELEEGVPVGGAQRACRIPSSSRTGRSRPHGRSGRASSPSATMASQISATTS